MGAFIISFGPELVWIWCKLTEKLKGRKVRKVEGGDSWVALSLSGGEVLLLSWGAQNCGIAQISEKEKKELRAGAKQTPPITNAIKSNIGGAELTDVIQLKRDRIIRLTFTKVIGAGFANTRHLIIEMMERYSNLILADENDVVLETAKHIHPADNRFRSVLPGHPYSMPPEYKGIPLEKWLATPSPESLGSVAGFGKKLLGILSDAEIEKTASLLSGFYKDESNVSSYIPQTAKNYLTALPILWEGFDPLTSGDIDDLGRFAVLSPITDSVLTKRRKALTIKIEREITRRERQIEDIERLLSKEDAEMFKRYGDALVANTGLGEAGKPEVTVKYWDENGDEITETVPLDPKYSLSKNASLYFAKYKKILAAQERAGEVLTKVREELNDLREQLAIVLPIDDAESLSLIEEGFGIKSLKDRRGGKPAKKSGPPLPPHNRFDLGYALVFVGLSSKGNRYVTFRLANPDDTWFHAQGVPGSHVILRFTSVPTEEERDDAIMFCAGLAAKYSKGGGPGQRVDYTLRKYVSPIKGGEANVTYREFKSVIA